MAGFLDNNTQVFDFILTQNGKNKLSQGKLNFKYYAFFDDEVDYDPFVSTSGTLDAGNLKTAKTNQIEGGLVLEALPGQKIANALMLDRLNVRNPLYTIPQGQNVLPRIVAVHQTSSVNLNVKQEKMQDLYLARDSLGNPVEKGTTDRGYRKYDPDVFNFQYSYTQNSFPKDYPLDGLKIQMYESGSNGLNKINPNYDLEHYLSFGSDLKLVSLNYKGTKIKLK